MEDTIMTNVKLRRHQRAKVECWSAKTGWTISDVIRAMIDGVELEVKPKFVTAQPVEQPTFVVLDHG